jgi:hypothetical protein
MNVDEFIGITTRFWSSFIGDYQPALANGLLRLNAGNSLFYPRLMLFTETNEHYMMELLGCQENYTGLETLHHQMESTEKFFNLFDGPYSKPCVLVGMPGVCLRQLVLSTQEDLARLNTRFRIDQCTLATIILPPGADCAIKFSSSEVVTFIDDCLLVNSRDEIHRVKQILHTTVVSKNVVPADYEARLQNHYAQERTGSTSFLSAVYLTNRTNAPAYAIHGQFLNMFLMPELRETSLGEFIRLHPEIIRLGFGCEDFLYEEQLPWLEGNPNPEEKFIRPDLLLKRQNGLFDICDLKKALHEKASITKGEHKRRRFIDYVAEGFAQLANYTDYFSFPRNREYALRERGIRVSDPALYLVVGSYENVSPQEVAEARRMLRPNHRIIDYDTLNTLFLKNRLAT